MQTLPYEAHLTLQALNDSRMALVYVCPHTAAGDAGVRKDGAPDEAEGRDERRARWPGEGVASRAGAPPAAGAGCGGRGTRPRGP